MRDWGAHFEMGRRWLRRSAGCWILGILTVLAGPRGAVAADRLPVPPRVIRSTRHDLSPPLRTVAPAAGDTGGGIREIPRLSIPERLSKAARLPEAGWRADRALQPRHALSSMPAPEMDFEGIHNIDDVLPPDTEGDVGPDHYVQWVNLSFAIWDKQGNLLYGPTSGNAFWRGFGGPCETSNDGDPIVLYDPLADRWLVSQFALPGFPSGPFYQCVAVSQTSDPTGAWHRYEFEVSATKMNDYPKLAVWPDGYYLSVNQFDELFLTDAGVGVAVLERDEMLEGREARMIYFDLEAEDPTLWSLLPSDMDGPVPPPDGSPAIFAQFDDDGWGAPQDRLRLFAFHADWFEPERSSFSPLSTLPTVPFDSDLCGYSRHCIPQPEGAPRLDPISDRLMYRLQYRNFGTHETLVVNHTVDSDGLDHAGIRWYELRNSGDGWAIYQQSTYAPDADHRWMGSVAMDGAGNMALGYSVASETLYPSIRYAGRLQGDPLDILAQGERTLIEAGGAQWSQSGRWGDYSMMAVDPVDDCTFWYTQEYYAASSNAGWRTRIGSFRFPSCQSPLTGILQGRVVDAATEAPVGRARVDAGPYTTFSDEEGRYRFSRLTPGSYEMTVTAYGYETVTSGGVQVAAGQTTTRDFFLTAQSRVTVSGVVRDGSGAGWPLYAKVEIEALPQGAVFTDPVTGVYRVELMEGRPVRFTVRAFTAGYEPVARVVTPVMEGQREDFALPVSTGTCEAPGYRRSLLAEDFEQTDGGYTHSGLRDEWEWGEPAGWPHGCGSGDRCWGTDLDGDYENGADQVLYSPPLDLPGVGPDQGLLIGWWQAWDVAPDTINRPYAEISMDGGRSWIEMWARSGGKVREGWTRKFFDVTSAAGGTIRLLWGLESDGSSARAGYYVDRVEIVICSAPQSGGLIVGNVYDANTMEPINGATVSSSVSTSAPTAGTDGDPDVNDGFFTLFVPDGSHELMAQKRGGYGLDVRTVEPEDRGVVAQDFFLPAGRLAAEPSELSAELAQGEILELELTIRNQGGMDAGFRLYGINAPFQRPEGGPRAGPARRLSPKHLHDRDARAVYDYRPPSAFELSAGGVVRRWRTGLDGVWGVGFNRREGDLWLGNVSAGGGDDRDYRFLADGTNTGQTIDTSAWVETFAADMAYNPATGLLWQVNVGGENCIHELDPSGLASTGRRLCPGFGTSQRGLAYDPVTDSFFSGSWNDGVIHRFDGTGAVLESVQTGLNVSGLAYNPATGHLFVLTNSDVGRDVYVLDVPGGYRVIGGFDVRGLKDFSQAGLAMDCGGHLLAVDQTAQRVIEARSGEAGACDIQIPWLGGSAETGEVPAGAERVVSLRVDSGELDLGSHEAQLRILGDTPYPAVVLPVTVTVAAPFVTGVHPDAGATGSLFRIEGRGFGGEKPKAFLQYLTEAGRKRRKKLEVVDWSGSHMECLWKRTLPAGRYDIKIKLAKKQESKIIVQGGFTVMPPRITALDPRPGGAVGDSVTVRGLYFGTRKGRVYLEPQGGVGKRKRCRIAKDGWSMDPQTGAGSVTFSVPRVEAGAYLLRLRNRSGEDTTGFTVEP